jgi:hypothetical protein
MHTIKWERPNMRNQTMSQCGRYWFVWMDDSSWPDDQWTPLRLVNGRYPASEQRQGSILRLWHDDTRTIVGHFETVAEAKIAAQEHYESMRRDMVLKPAPTNR